MFGGPFNDLLLELNDNSDWRQILGKPHKDPRQKDAELMVRFFALRNLDEYEKPLKDYLSRFMRRHRHADKKFLEKSRAVFEQTCETVLKELGPKPFHVRAGLNAAVFDSVMVAFSEHPSDIPKNVKKRYDRLVIDEDYVSYISSGTTGEEVVRKRFGLAKKILFE